MTRRQNWGTALAVGGVLALALGLRLWGIRHGLPFAYNVDEDAHFVREAVRMFSLDTLNPQYFVNPPALTYALYAVLGVWFGGGEEVRRALDSDPTALFTVARVTVAIAGTLAVGLLYALGARLFDRRVALLAAALLAVAFLPVFYSHQALNDVPALVPLTLSLIGAAGIAGRGRRRDYLLAGAGLGLAVATKYTAGIAIVPLAAALLIRGRDAGGRDALKGAALAGGAALAAFCVANPFAVLDFDSFRADLDRQASAAGGTPKLGTGEDSGIPYYLWSLSWGLGWVPALAAGIGAIALWRRNRRAAALLTPVLVPFLLYMGLQERFFGRWLLPAYPVLCLLAAYAAARAVELVPATRRRARVAAAGLAVVALLGQGLAYSVHNDLALSREDTRNLARAFLLEHVPPGARVAVEPLGPSSWHEPWRKLGFSTARANNPGGRPRPGLPRIPSIDNIQLYLRPQLVDEYERTRHCIVVSVSTQWGRAFREPQRLAEAVAYYRELDRRAETIAVFGPYDPGIDPGGPGDDPVRFNFDWSFDYYPLAYHRPGPVVLIRNVCGPS